MPRELPDLRRTGDYVRALFAPEDQVLRDLLAEAAREGLPEIHITSDVARFLQVLERAVGARRVLEIGTLGGYSTIWLARALPPGGKLVTLELSHERAAFARLWIGRAGLGEVVEVRVGDARALLKSMDGEEPFDLAFIDADKESYPEYLERCLELVRPGGIIAADNVLGSPDWKAAVSDPDPQEPVVRAIQEFNRRLATHPRLTAVALPIREGVAVAVVG